MVDCWILKRKKPTSVSEGAEIPKGTGKTPEASDFLKLKNEAFEAKDLWKERNVSGGAGVLGRG